jgi:hypothetical protein
MNNTSSTGGIGFTGLLTIVFIVLKLCGVIHWSWLWVLAPLWIGLAVFIIFFIIVLIMIGSATLLLRAKGF